MGGATDAGVAKVTMLMDVSDDLEASVSERGQARDHTGTDNGGGGSIDWEAKADILPVVAQNVVAETDDESVRRCTAEGTFPQAKRKREG